MRGDKITLTGNKNGIQQATGDSVRLPADKHEPYVETCARQCACCTDENAVWLLGEGVIISQTAWIH